MQTTGVIRKGSAREQIEHRTESFYSAEELATNAYFTRLVKSTDLYYFKIVGTYARKRRPNSASKSFVTLFGDVHPRNTLLSKYYADRESIKDSRFCIMQALV